MQAAFPLDFLTSVGGPLLAALLPRHRPMDAVTVTIDSPSEEEMAMACFGTLSFFHAFFFPRWGRRIYREALDFDGIGPARVEAWWRDYHYFLKKVQCAQPRRRLLLKNPANSVRVAALHERFPDARFIHIHRHPEEVYASTLYLHRKLQEVWALQEDDPARLRETTLQNYADLMTACFVQTEGMDERELIAVRMTDLEQKPVVVLEAVYQQLELPGFDAASARFSAYLERYHVVRYFVPEDEKVTKMATFTFAKIRWPFFRHPGSLIGWLVRRRTWRTVEEDARLLENLAD